MLYIVKNRPLELTQISHIAINRALEHLGISYIAMNRPLELSNVSHIAINRALERSEMSYIARNRSLELSDTCRIQNPDKPRAGRVGAHGGVGQNWRGRAELNAYRTVRPGNKGPSYPPKHREHVA